MREVITIKELKEWLNTQDENNKIAINRNEMTRKDKILGYAALVYLYITCVIGSLLLLLFLTCGLYKLLLLSGWSDIFARNALSVAYIISGVVIVITEIYKWRRKRKSKKEDTSNVE